MIWTSENNWYKWKYDNSEFFSRKTSYDQKLKTVYTRSKINLENFKKELEKAAASTLDHYPGLTPCIFFSGGVDSEAILRSYINIGSKPKVYIIRFENDYNIYDVSYAITICNSLGIDYNLIDFNLQKFYENDAEIVSEQSQICRPRMLPHLKFTDCAEGLIIVGHSDVRYFRPNDDYSKKTLWLAQDFEHDVGCDKYNIFHNREAVYQWWRWTPGLVISYTQMLWFKKLINDEFIGKLGINSTKIQGYREFFPDMIYRKKMTGFESIDPLINEFESFLKKKYNNHLPFRDEHIRTIDELCIEILGVKYAEIQ